MNSITLKQNILKIKPYTNYLKNKLKRHQIEYILKNAGVKTVLVSSKKDAKRYSIVKCVIDVNNKGINKFNNKNINIRVRSTDLAFIVYTSGSTGNPKGVMINHQGVINHALTKIKVANINSRDIISVNLSVGFVAFIWQLIAPLMIGARAQIYSDQIFSNVIGLIKNCTKDNVTIFEISPSLFSVYLDSLGKDYLKESRFKKILLTGEKIPPELVNKHYQRYQIQLINAYGQAECSDDTLHYVIPKNIKTNTVPAGKP